MSKQDRQGVRTATDLERKYNFGKSFGEVYGLLSDAQRAIEQANEAILGLDSKLDSEEIFNRLTNYGQVQGIYRGNDNEIYINATYIRTGTVAYEQLPSTVAKTSDIPKKLSELFDDVGYQTESGVTTIVGGIVTTDYINALGISVAAANITGLLSANQIKMGGEVNFYESLEDDSDLAGFIGYMNVQSTAGFSGSALGIKADLHAMLYAPNGNLVAASYGDAFIGSSAGFVRMSGTELKFNGKAIMERLTSFETAFNALGVNFTWGNDD